MLSRKQKDELKALYRDFYTQPTSQKLATFQHELEKKKKFFFENQAQQLEFKRLNVTPEQIDYFVEQVEARGVDELARNMESSVSGAEEVAARAKSESSYYSMLRLVAQHQDKRDFNVYHQAVQLPLPPEPPVERPKVPAASSVGPSAASSAVTSAPALAGPSKVPAPSPASPVGSPAASPVGSPAASPVGSPAPSPVGSPAASHLGSTTVAPPAPPTAAAPSEAPAPASTPPPVAPKKFRCVDFFAQELGLKDVVEVYQKADWKRDVLTAITEEATRLQVEADLDENEFAPLLFYLQDKKSTLLEALRDFLNEKKCEVFIPLFDQMYERPENNDITFAIALGLCCVCRTKKDAELTHFSSENNEKMVALCSELKRRVGKKARSCLPLFDETSPNVYSLFYAAQCYSHYVSLTDFRAILGGLSSRAAPSAGPPLVPSTAPPLVPPPATSPEPSPEPSPAPSAAQPLVPSPAAATAPSASPPLASSTVVAKVPTEKLTCDSHYQNLEFHPSFSLTFYKRTKEDDPLSTSVRNLTETQRNMLKSIYGKPHHERVLRNLNVVAGSLTPTNWKKFTRETLHDSKHVRELNQIFDTVYGDSTDVTVAVLLCACKFNWEVAEECLEHWFNTQGRFPFEVAEQNIIAVYIDFRSKYGTMVGECILDETKTTFSIKEILDKIRCFLPFVHCKEFCEILLQERTSAPTSVPKAPTSPPKAPTPQVVRKSLSNKLPNVGGNNCFLNAFLQMFSRLPEAEHFGAEKEFGKLFQNFLRQPSDTDGEGKRQILIGIDEFLKREYREMYSASRQQDPSEIFIRGLGELTNVKQLFSFGFKKVFYRNSDLTDEDCNQRAFEIALKQKSFQQLNTVLEEQFNIVSKVEPVISREHFASVRGWWTDEKKYDVRIEPMLSREVHVGTSTEHVTLSALMEENEYSTSENYNTYKVDAKGNPLYRDGNPVFEVDCIHETYCCFSKYFFINIKRSVWNETTQSPEKNPSYVEIPEKLNVSGVDYVLFGMLCHHGDSPRGGHWTATVKSFGWDSYTVYNDAKDPQYFTSYAKYVEMSGHVDKRLNRDDRTCLLYMKI